jgi:hypothetical protein
MSSETVDKKTVFGMPYNVGIGFLCVLGALCLYEFYSNVLAGPAIPDGVKSTAAIVGGSAPAIAIPDALSSTSRRPASTQRRNSEEFNPFVHSKRPEDRIDPSKVDPTLRLDLLAKVQGVELAGGARNLFQMGAPPPPKVELPKGPETIVSLIGPRPPAPVVPAAVPPPAPVLPIGLKYYGLSKVVSNGKATGFFMDGEDPLIAGEGDMIKRRYLVIKILATSVLVEDTESKRRESLPITPEAQS